MPSPRRSLALFLPWLPAERARRAGPKPPDAPFVLVAMQRGAMRITAGDVQAARLGLAPGMALAQARAQLPGLVCLPADPAADARALAALVRLCGAYSPVVAAEPPQGVMLDVTGCAHRFGDEAGLEAHLRGAVAALGFTPCIAIAATPDAARALARFGGGEKDIKRLPLAALELPEESRLALRRAGLRTVGDVAALPRPVLAARFGAVLPRLLARLLEGEDVRIPARPARDPVRAALRFAEPLGRTDDVLEAIEALLAEVGRTMAERDEGGRAFTVRLHRSDGHVATLTIETGLPTRDPALVLRLLRERIDSLADPLDPGFGYDSVDLAVPRTDPLLPDQPELDGAAARPRAVDPGRLAALLDRLAVRHGPDCVQCLSGADSHVPERAGQAMPRHAAPPAPDWPAPEPGEPPLRPLTLLDPPQRVEVIAAVPDGPPRRFRWRGHAHVVVRQEGPERIAPEWWRRRGGHDDNPGLTRDYYRVEDEAGHRFWLFRHGLYGAESADPHWYVHGCFA